jgi:hypothetical protein
MPTTFVTVGMVKYPYAAMMLAPLYPILALFAGPPLYVKYCGLLHPIVCMEVTAIVCGMNPKVTEAYDVSPSIPSMLFQGVFAESTSFATVGGFGPTKIPTVEVPVPLCIVYVPANPAGTVTYAVNVVGVTLRTYTVCPLRKDA